VRTIAIAMRRDVTACFSVFVFVLAIVRMCARIVEAIFRYPIVQLLQHVMCQERSDLIALRTRRHRVFAYR